MKLYMRSLLPGLLAALCGLAIGIVDFVSTDFRLALLLTALAGGLLGYLFPQRRWTLSIYIGLFVPVAIVFGMASRHRPARGHFVLIDARAVVPALLGAALGGRARDTRRSEDLDAEKTK